MSREWEMGNGEWGMGKKDSISCSAFRIPHSPNYDSAALVFAARLTLFLASGFFATTSSPLTVL